MNAHTASTALGKSPKLGIAVLVGISLPLLLALLLIPPVAQNLAYHDYADQRLLLGVPYFWNVASNLPFAAIGLLGCWLLTRRDACSKYFSEPWERRAYLVFFAGEFLTCFGSGYYHATPSNESLLWDRLVFSLLLTSFFTIIVTDCLSRRVGRLMLAPMVAIGLYSVIHWHRSELVGNGDLRFYIFVQFYPVLITPLILSLFPPSWVEGRRTFLSVWLLYGLAKVCEMLDRPIYDLTGIWSGHTLKHFVAATASFWVLKAVLRRKKGPTHHLSAQIG